MVPGITLPPSCTDFAKIGVWHSSKENFCDPIGQLFEIIGNLPELIKFDAPLCSPMDLSFPTRP